MSAIKKILLIPSIPVLERAGGSAQKKSSRRLRFSPAATGYGLEQQCKKQ